MINYGSLSFQKLVLECLVTLHDPGNKRIACSLDVRPTVLRDVVHDELRDDVGMQVQELHVLPQHIVVVGFQSRRVFAVSSDIWTSFFLELTPAMDGSPVLRNHSFLSQRVLSSLVIPGKDYPEGTLKNLERRVIPASPAGQGQPNFLPLAVLYSIVQQIIIAHSRWPQHIIKVIRVEALIHGGIRPYNLVNSHYGDL